MQRTMVEEYTSTPEGMAEFQRERVILEIAILIRKLLKEQGLTKADLATRLGRSKAFITQILNGRANMTLRHDLGCDVRSGPIPDGLFRTSPGRGGKHAPHLSLQSARESCSHLPENDHLAPISLSNRLGETPPSTLSNLRVCG